MAQTESSDSPEAIQETINEVNALLEADPSNAEYLNIRELLEQQLEDAKAGSSASHAIESTLSPSPPPLETESEVSQPAPPQPKWSKEDHPAFRPGHQIASTKPNVEEAKLVEIKVNDFVMGKWPGDNRDYKAKVMSITGSRAAPMYTVKWTVDGSTDTIRAGDVKTISTQSDLKKRKADGSTATAAPSAPPANPGVISAAASLNPAAVKAPRPQPSKCSDGPPRPEKKPKVLGGKRALENSKSTWQAWQTGNKSGKKAAKSTSIFRTGDPINARVKFGGTSQEQVSSKDQPRSRHEYEKEEQ